MKSGNQPPNFSALCTVYLGICDWKILFTLLDEVMRLAKCNTDYFLWSGRLSRSGISQSVSIGTRDKSHTNCHHDVMSVSVCLQTKYFIVHHQCSFTKTSLDGGITGCRVRGNFLDNVFKEASEFCLWKILRNLNGW